MPVDLRELLSGRAMPKDRFANKAASGTMAVLTMEIQRGIMGDLSTLPALAAACEKVHLVENTARLLDAARSAGLPVLHCVCGYRPDGAGSVVNTPMHSAVLRTTGHLLEGTPDTEIVHALGPAPSDLVMSRVHGVSPFAGTSLDVTLRNLGVRVLVVTGVSVNLGVLGLCIEAVNHGYQVAIPVDSVAGVPEDYAERVLRTTLRLIATLTTVDDVIAALPTRSI